MDRWDPVGFHAAAKKAKMSWEEISLRLFEGGWATSVYAVRRWAWKGSPGPKHPVQAVALSQILECAYEDLLKEADEA